MVRVLEAVPNFSEGRDLSKVRALVDTIAASGVEVLDWSADPDHHRCVISYIGDPDLVVRASIAAARFARDHIDLRDHDGVHPCVGALDVMPLVPLHGVDMVDAIEAAHRVGRAIADLGVPVFYYGHASEPAGRALSELRRGGFKGLANGFPEDRRPQEPASAERAHVSAGVTCVGARPVLLAWNVFLSGITRDQAREIASQIRERDGGFVGLRALGLHLASQDRVQISMNLEDPAQTPPLAVFSAIERAVHAQGGDVVETQVIGMIPDALVLPTVQDRLHPLDLKPARILSHRVRMHVQGRLNTGTPTSDDVI
jgi:glutamate formiminotransferase